MVFGSLDAGGMAGWVPVPPIWIWSGSAEVSLRRRGVEAFFLMG